MKLRLIAISFFVALVGIIERARADLVFVSGLRGVSTSATNGLPDSSFFFAAGKYSDSAMTTGTNPGDSYSASTLHSSLAPDPTGPQMTGFGHAESSISASGSFSYNTAAETIYEVSFLVDANGLYNLDTLVTWSGNVPPFIANNQAYIELRNVTTNTQLVYTFRNVASPGTLSSSYTVPLGTGATYQLTAFTRVQGDGMSAGSFSATGFWSFDLTAAAIPEAGSVAMMTLATFATAAGAWWRHRRQHCG